jgi:hypothetical protein
VVKMRERWGYDCRSSTRRQSGMYGKDVACDVTVRR